MLLDHRSSALMLIDLQEKLMPAMHEPAGVLRNALILLAAAGRLGVPTMVTEQYPQGLGPTVPEIGDRCRAVTSCFPR
jgi:hypothetical protein